MVCLAYVHSTGGVRVRASAQHGCLQQYGGLSCLVLQHRRRSFTHQCAARVRAATWWSFAHVPTAPAAFAYAPTRSTCVCTSIVVMLARCYSAGNLRVRTTDSIFVGPNTKLCSFNVVRRSFFYTPARKLCAAISFARPQQNLFVSLMPTGNYVSPPAHKHLFRFKC